MKKLIVIALFSLGVGKVYSQAEKGVLITAFGAKADGKTNNTSFIQKAIDKAAIKGGTVVIPAGKFVTGPIVLKSGVELNLQTSAVLLGSTNRLDYGKGEAMPLISAKGQKNIAITGRGVIDARGAEVVEDLYRLLKAGIIQDNEWKIKRPEERNRPRIISFADCSNVLVKAVTIKNGAGWIQDYNRCTNLTIDSITVKSTAYWNNDGIDIVNSRNVTITNCYVDAADDAICLKSEGRVTDSCVNVYIANCILRSSANAIKFGTASRGGFRNVIVRNIEVFDTYRSAIALEAVDGGVLENVDVRHVKARNTGNAFFIKLGHRNKDDLYSTVRNIHISDLYAEIPAGKPDKGYPMEGPLLRYPKGIFPAAAGEFQSVSPWNKSGNDSTAIEYKHNVFPSSVTGLPDHLVEDITLENITIVYEGGADKSIAYLPVEALTKITEAESSYPEFSMFGELPCWGLYVRHAKNITMKNVVMRYQHDDFRTAAIFDDVSGLKLENVTIPSYTGLPILLLNNVRDHSLRQLKFPVEEAKAVKIQ